MASPSEKLAQSLEILEKFQDKNGKAVIKSKDLTRTHKDRLVSNGFLKEIIKGWYISSSPDVKESDATPWYTSFWKFISIYCKDRFGKEWCLSPDQSLLIHTGNLTVPKQLIIRSPKAKNNITELLYETSIFDIELNIPDNEHKVVHDEIQLYSLPNALIACSPEFFTRHPFDARICLMMIKDPSEILPLLLEGGHSVKAGRIAGAFRNVGMDRVADEISAAMKSAGYSIREEDPFVKKLDFQPGIREISPYVNRIRMIWSHMRKDIVKHFPKSPGLPENSDAYIKRMDDLYVSDAYHSLSIEGYRVTNELIEKVRSGNWNPDTDGNDQEQISAMAARGYWQAFQEVKKSLFSVLQGENPGEVVENDHSIWYRELFVPNVTAGLQNPSDLAGYRRHQVYIRGARHTPPNRDAVLDAMPVFFDLLKEEPEPAVRAVLGHFIFVYIHPYMDGNGRIGRFLMNVMMASGGYPWTVIPSDKYKQYQSALEKASVESDIEQFTLFLANILKQSM